jgi:hypothetical protein
LGGPVTIKNSTTQGPVSDAAFSRGAPPVGSVIAFYNTLLPAGQIGNFVWNDLNGNGVQDSGEPGIAGQTVTLNGPGGTQTTTTDANGNYLFTGLSAGSYTVTVGTPSGFNASPSNQGGNSNTDSNGSPATVVLASNASVDLSIDFGFVVIPPPPQSCTLTQGYWKNHAGDWDQASDGKIILTTGAFYNSGYTNLGILGIPPKGNAYIILAHQFVAARLNTNGNSSGIAAVDQALAGAAAYYASAPAGLPVPTDPLRAQLIAWSTVLDDYNNGRLGVPHCP